LALLRYDQLDLSELLDRQIGQLLALENAAGVDAGLTVRVRKIASAVNQATGSRAPTGKYIAAIE
jgi:hypothetical protein